MARRYRSRHSRESHICSVSERGEKGASFAEEVGRVVQPETVLWRELYFVVCSVVRSGGGGMVADLEGCAKGVLRSRRESSSTSAEEVEECAMSVVEISGAGLPGASGSTVWVGGATSAAAIVCC